MGELITVRVEGERSEHGVFVFALSTCGWCKRTKEFLRENDVAFEYVDVDKCTMDEKREVGRILKERDVPLGFPVTIVDDEVVISGFKPDEFREALGL
ncbi:glutaredoxin family protein [Candidatus Bathyarchaeota archaeon]|nr:glutaredoxin family protein [Candidatus Bathyarchaeota archaeon]MBL7080541.1 glutaredoxin family protein [Candidatus Bathyarchaeota archaeon]